jgi:hypothetical protein
MRVYDSEIVPSMRRGEESFCRMFVRNAVGRGCISLLFGLSLLYLWARIL